MKQVVITIEDDEEKMNKEIQNKLILDACCGIPYKFHTSLCLVIQQAGKVRLYG